MTEPGTNANSALLANLLSNANVGTFTGLVVRKKGEQRGPKGAKQTFGDDLVHTVIMTGFRYDRLVQRALDALNGLEPKALVAEADTKGLKGWARVWTKSAKVGDLRAVADQYGVDADVTGKGPLVAALEGIPAISTGQTQVRVTHHDMVAAISKLRESFERTLDPDQESTSTTDHIYEPLVVDGETVRGCRVYKCVADMPDVECHCRNCTDNPKAPLPGTIYIQGLQVWSKVIEPAPNGPKPKAKSGSAGVATRVIESHLPTRKYVSYALEPGTDFVLRAGGTAVTESTKAGFVVTDAIVDILLKAGADIS